MLAGSALARARLRRHRSERDVELRRYQAIVETAHEGIWTIDHGGITTFVNPQMAAMLGFEPAELLGTAFTDRYFPEEIPGAHARMEARRRGATGSHETRLRRRDGSEIWVHMATSPLLDERGVSTGSLAMVTDVTARRASERRLHEAQRLAGLGSWEWDPHADSFACSPAAVTIFGIEHIPPPHRYADFLSTLAPGEREQIDAKIHAALTREGTYVLETTVVRPDGEHRFIQVRGELERGPDGRVARVHGTTLDLTERRRGEEELRVREQRYRDIVETSHDLIWSTDVDGRLTFVNAACQDLLGCAPEQLLGRRLIDHVAPDRRDEAAAAFEGVLRGDALSLFETQLVAADGRVLDVLTNVVGQPGRDGRPAGILGTTTDVTAQRRARRELEAAREQFAQAFEHAPIGMALVELDPDGGVRYLRVNEAIAAITGHSRAELVGRFAADLGAGLADGELTLIRRLVAGEIRRYQVSKPVDRPDGSRRWVALSVSAVRDQAGRAAYGVLQAEDITERREYEQRLQHLADHDALTDLFNRRRFEEEVRRQIAHSARYGESGAILVLDLDSFKYANDSFGHQAGDALIRGAAQLLRGRLRETDVLARLGGDEFAVLLPRADRAGAERVAADLLDALGTDPIVIDERTGQAIHLTASLGIALFQRTTLSHDDLLALADVAMYQAKEAGRNGYAVCEADDGHQEILAERLSLMQRIREALAGEGFVLHGQPIIELGTGRATHQEVLLRLRGEDGALIGPATFIPVAEAFGLMGAVDRWVVHAAIELAAAQQEAGEDLRLEVNLSAQSLADPTFPAAVEEELMRHGVEPSRLIFEVTETAAIGNFHQARAFIERLRALGCAFALDDFGAGYGSFRYLKHLPFDLLKIDGDFIRDLPRSPRDQMIVRALVAAAQGLGKRTVAEFVSDDATVDLLREWGVDYAQGYHLARPGPVSAGGASSSEPAVT